MRIFFKIFYYILTSILLFIKILFWIFFSYIFILHHNINLNLQKYIKIPIKITYSGYWNISNHLLFINTLNIKSNNNTIFNINKILLKKEKNKYNIKISNIFIDYKKLKTFSNSPSKDNPDTKQNIPQQQIDKLFYLSPNFKINIKKLQIINFLEKPINLNIQIKKDSNIAIILNLKDIRYNKINIPKSEFITTIFPKDNYKFYLHIQTIDKNMQSTFKGNLLPLKFSYQLHINNINDLYNLQKITGLNINKIFLNGKFLQNDSLIKIDSILFKGLRLYNTPITIKSNKITLKENFLSISNLSIINKKNTINLNINYDLQTNNINMASNIDIRQIPKEITNMALKTKGKINISNLNIKTLHGDITSDFRIYLNLYDEIIKMRINNNMLINPQSILLKNVNIKLFNYNLKITGSYNFSKNLVDISGEIKNNHNKFNIKEHKITTDSMKINFYFQNNNDNISKLDFMLFANQILVDTIKFKKPIIMAEDIDIKKLKYGNFKIHIKGLYENNKILLPDIFANFKFIGEKKILLNPVIVKINNRDYISINSVFDFKKFPYTLKLNNSQIKYDILNFDIGIPQNIEIDSFYNIILPNIKIALNNSEIIKCNGNYNLMKSTGKFYLIANNIPINFIEKNLSDIIDFEIPLKEGHIKLSSNITIDSTTDINANVNIKIKDFFLYNYFIDSLTSSINYNKKEIILNSLNINNPDNNFTLKGEFNPTSFNYNFILYGEGQIPMILSEFIDSLYMISGYFKLNSNITGTQKKFKLKGNFIIDSTELFFTFLDNKISNFKANILLKDDSILINKFSACAENTTTQKGFSLFDLFRKKTKINENISGEGKLCISNHNFILNTEYKDLFLKYLPIKSNFLINGKLNISLLKGLPYIKGDIYFKQFNLTDDFSDYITSQNDSIYTFYNITLHFPNNFWIKNKYMNMETGGSIKIWLEDFKEYPEIYGSLNVKRGELYVYGTTFKINKGVIKFTKANKLNPEFDIQATTKLKDLTITLYFRGTLQNPEFNFTSYPIILSQEEIIKYFFGSITDKMQNSNISKQAENIMSDILMQKISQIGVKKLGFDQFKLSSNKQQNISGVSEIIERLRFSDLKIGKYITPNLFISYKGKLNLIGDKSVSIEYYLNNNFSIIGEKKIDGNYKMGIRFKTDF